MREADSDGHDESKKSHAMKTSPDTTSISVLLNFGDVGGESMA